MIKFHFPFSLFSLPKLRFALPAQIQNAPVTQSVLTDIVNFIKNKILFPNLPTHRTECTKQTHKQ